MSPAARTALLAAALACAACGDAPASPAPTDGSRLYVQANCSTCHGSDGAGGVLGPALRGLDAHWTPESLAAYLADPKAGLESIPRLKTLSLNFSMHMPPVLNMTPEQRRAIAEHALALSAKAR